MKSFPWPWLKRIPRWLPTVLTVSAVLYLTLFPDPVPDNDLPLWEHTDKVVHALMMAAVWTALAVDLRRPLTPRLRLGLFLAVTAFGALIELAQQAMDLGRTADLADLAADTLGAPRPPHPQKPSAPTKNITILSNSFQIGKFFLLKWYFFRNFVRVYPTYSILFTILDI